MTLLALLVACGSPVAPDPGTEPTETTATTPTTETAPPPTTPTTDVVGTLLVNEVMTDNESTWQLEDDALPDWIEFYNPGPDPVDLSTVSVADGSGAVWRGPDGVIPPLGYLLVAADGPEVQDSGLPYPPPVQDTGFGGATAVVQVLPFDLNNNGDELTVQVGNRITDRIVVPALDGDVSWMRLGDGGAVWGATAAPTPGAANALEPSLSLDPTDLALSADLVHSIKFELTTQQLQSLDGWEENWAWGELTLDDIHFDQVDLRLKGSASFDTLDGKPAFKVDVNQYLQGREFRGLKGFKLHNGNVLDPTRTRDYLTYQLARESGLMAPRVGWAEVWINDTYYGIYMMIEDYDDRLIDEWYPGQGGVGALFEPNEAQGGGFGWGDFCSGPVSFQFEDGPLLPDPLLLDALNNASDVCGRTATDANVAELWNYVDQEAFLTYMAWETLVNHTDGYKAPNNWRVYVGSDYLVRLVPTGAEWTWDFAPDPWWFGGQLAGWCLENPGCTEAYAVEVLEMADRVEDLQLYDQFVDLSAWLDPYLDKDPRSPHSTTAVQNARSSTATRLQDNPGLMRDEVHQRFPGL